MQKTILMIVAVALVGCGKGDAERQVAIEKAIIHVQAKNYNDALLVMAEYQGSDKSQIQAKVEELIKWREEEMDLLEVQSIQNRRFRQLLSFGDEVGLNELKSEMEETSKKAKEVRDQYTRVKEALEKGEF